MLQKILVLAVLGILIQSGNCKQITNEASHRIIYEGFAFTYYRYLGDGKYEGNELTKLKLDREKKSHLFIPSTHMRGYIDELRVYFESVNAYKDGTYNFVYVEYPPFEKNKTACSADLRKKIAFMISSDLNALKKKKNIEFERIITHGRAAAIITAMFPRLEFKADRVMILDPVIEEVESDDYHAINQTTANVVEIFYTSSEPIFRYNLYKTYPHRKFALNGGRAPQKECLHQCGFPPYCDSILAAKYYFEAMNKDIMTKKCYSEKDYNNNQCQARYPDVALYNSDPPTDYYNGRFYFVS